jgi:hypothetical protein
MKVKEFTYKKANGEVSQRTVLELVSPTEHVEGIDVTSLDMDSYAAFVEQLKLIEDELYARRLTLYSDFDLKHNYRRFVPSNMSNVTTEFI